MIYSHSILTHVQNNKEVHTFTALIIFSYKLSEKLKFVFVKSGSKCALLREANLHTPFHAAIQTLLQILEAPSK